MFRLRVFSRSRRVHAQPPASRGPSSREISPAFYEAWLGTRMMHSCAYYAAGVEGLEAAQEAKLDYVCRKLRLHPGERLLDLGCGWGGLMQFAAERFGVDASGVTRRPCEAAHAAKRMAAAGLAARCTVQAVDYRKLRGGAEFDKIASIEMFDQLERPRLPGFFRLAYDLLRPRGLFLVQGVVAVSRPATRAEATVRRLFLRQDPLTEPSVTAAGELVPLADVIAAAEATGFETREVESFREHYVRTMRDWAARLADPACQAAEHLGDHAARVWRAYLATSANAFAARRVGAVQILLTKPESDRAVPLRPS